MDSIILVNARKAYEFYARNARLTIQYFDHLNTQEQYAWVNMIAQVWNEAKKK